MDRERGFRGLEVWKRSKDLAVRVYRVTRSGPLARDYGLRDQMQRAAVSVCSNIAEGAERDAIKDSIRFFQMAKGSAAELATQLEIAREIGHLPESIVSDLLSDCTVVAKKLGALIRARTAFVK